MAFKNFSVVAGMMLAVIAAFLPAQIVFAYEQPEFFGGYAVEDDTLIELNQFHVTLKGYQFGEHVVTGFSNLPGDVKTLSTLSPKLILYDQAISTGGVHLSQLIQVPLGKDESAGFIYVPSSDVGVRIKPLDQDGMFLFKPTEPLETGHYALYGGTTLGVQGSLSGMVFPFEVRHPRQQEIYQALADLVNAVKLKDEDAAASLCYTVAGTTPVPVSSSMAEKLRKPFGYTGGGSVTPVGIKEMSDETGTYYHVKVLVYGAIISISLSDTTLLGNSGKAMYVREVDGKFKVFIKDRDWMFAAVQ